MNILFISQYFFPEQVSNNSISRELVQRGHDVNVYTAVPNYPAGVFFEGFSNKQRSNEKWEGIDVARVWTIPRGKRKLQLLLNYLAFPLAATFSLLRDQVRPDVIFVSQLSPIFMVIPGIVQSWRSKAPLVYWVQDLWPESATFTLGIKNRFAKWALDGICGWLYRRADMVMVQSEAFRDVLSQFGIPNDRIRVLPNTAPHVYQPLSSADAPELASVVPQDGFRLMFAGNIGESQDFDTLVAAAGILRNRQDICWIIVGSGRDEARARQLVIDQGVQDKFVFLGRHPEEAMPRFFAHADAMLVSLKDTPIFSRTVPYKVQCYMACGKPIVASLSGEGARIVEESGAGLAAPASQPELLAAKIAEMADASIEQRERYAQNANKYFNEKYSAEKVYGDLEQALKDAVAMRPSSR